MKSEFTTETQKSHQCSRAQYGTRSGSDLVDSHWTYSDEPGRYRSLYRTAPIALLLTAAACIFAPLQAAFSQSGRDPQTESKGRKADKRRYPDPPPIIRLPEQKGKDGKDVEGTIRINSDLVNVVVTIGGRPINASLDLRPEDFEILEDDAPQEIANFSRTADQPLKLVMLFDTSLSVTHVLDFERRAAARFFERVIRPQDRAALFSFSTDVVVLQEFTNKLSMLVDATRRLQAIGSTSLYDAIYLASDYLKPADGRRVIVIISDGGDTTSSKGLLESLTQAQKSDSSIFAIFTGNPFPSENLRDLAAERALESLTKETGGELFKPRLPNRRRQDEEIGEISLKELDRSFADLAERLRTQYVLGFYSTNEKRDGAFRKLNVRIKKPNYIARARTGYYAPKE